MPPDEAPATPTGSTRARPIGLLIAALVLLVARILLGLYEERHPPRLPDLVGWQPIEGAEARAFAQHRAVLYDFTAEWCAPCQMMQREVFADLPSAREIEREHAHVSSLRAVGAKAHPRALDAQALEVPDRDRHRLELGVEARARQIARALAVDFREERRLAALEETDAWTGGALERAIADLEAQRLQRLTELPQRVRGRKALQKERGVERHAIDLAQAADQPRERLSREFAFPQAAPPWRRV